MTMRKLGPNLLGIISLITLLFLWVALLAPFTWGVRFPGAAAGGVLAILSAIVFPVIAAIWGSRRWLVVSAVAVLTLAYILIFTNSAVWH